MEFNTNYKRQRQDGEQNKGPCHVEPGAVSIRERILSMQAAGAALQVARAEMYDFKSEDEVSDEIQVKIGRYNERLDLLRESRILSQKFANRAKELQESKAESKEVEVEADEAKEEPKEEPKKEATKT